MSEQIERVEKTDRIKPPALRWEGISPVDIILKQPTTEPSLNKNNRVLEVKLYWGDVIMETVHKNITSAITIGEDPKSTFRVSSDRLSNPHSFELVRPDSTGNICFGTGDVPITIKRQGKVYDFEQAKELKLLDSKEGKYSFRIELEDIVIVKIDELYFVIRYVTPAKAIPFSIWDTLDYYFWTIWTLSFIAHMFFLIAVQITDPNVDYLTEDLFENPNRFVQLLLKPPEKKKIPKRFQKLSGKQGAKAKKKEGKFGKLNKPKKDALSSKKGAPKLDRNKREEDRKKVMKSGLLSLLNKGAGSSASSNILGPGGLGTGINKSLGGIGGTQQGDAGGFGGLGTRGSGPGGGGAGLGIGGLGTGRGRGAGGMGNIDLGGRGKARVAVTPTRIVTIGGLTKQQIQQALRRAMNRIKYCYEKELPKDPNLNGKIEVNWIIKGNGRVGTARVRQTTMNNSTVESCVVRVIKSIRFPKPKGGGQVDVNYPFVFNTAG